MNNGQVCACAGAGGQDECIFSWWNKVSPRGWGGLLLQVTNWICLKKIGISKSKWHLPLKQFFCSKIRVNNNNDDDVRKHQCVSNARGARSDQVPDLPVNNNAKPDGQLHISADAEAYFTFDGNGQAKSNNYHSIHDNDNDDNQWIVD